MTQHQIFSKIIHLIQKYPVIICQRHQSPDPDAIGSQHGLAHILKRSFPKKQIFCTGKTDPNLKWLGHEDQVSDEAYQKSLVIVTDCANRPRISDSRYNTGQALIKIDHHPNVDQFGDVQWVNPLKSSACEMIYDLCAALPQLKMDDQSAALLYAGIVGDTGRFMFSNVSPHTLQVTAQLAKYHFSMNKINQKEIETTLNVSRLYGYLQQHLHVFKNGTAYYLITQKLLKQFKVSDQTFISKNLPGNIDQIVAWGYFKEQRDGTFKVSLRSHAPAINKLAAKYNGGGHALASGALVQNLSQVKAVIKDLHQVVDQFQNQK